MTYSLYQVICLLLWLWLGRAARLPRYLVGAGAGALASVDTSILVLHENLTLAAYMATAMFMAYLVALDRPRARTMFYPGALLAVSAQLHLLGLLGWMVISGLQDLVSRRLGRRVGGGPLVLVAGSLAAAFWIQRALVAALEALESKRLPHAPGRTRNICETVAIKEPVKTRQVRDYSQALLSNFSWVELAGLRIQGELESIFPPILAWQALRMNLALGMGASGDARNADEATRPVQGPYLAMPPLSQIGVANLVKGCRVKDTSLVMIDKIHPIMTRSPGSDGTVTLPARQETEALLCLRLTWPSTEPQGGDYELSSSGKVLEPAARCALIPDPKEREFPYTEWVFYRAKLSAVAPTVFKVKMPRGSSATESDQITRLIIAALVHASAVR